MRELLLLSIHVIASSAAEPLRSVRSQSAGFRLPREGESALALFVKHEPMDKNRIAGKPCWTSGQMITKSIFIKSQRHDSRVGAR